MKKKHIIFISLLLIITIIYLYIFSGIKELPTSTFVEKYDPFFNSLIMPIAKYEKGFFTHTFYAQTKIKGQVYDIRFKINYLNHTVTVEDFDKLTERISMISSKIARPAVRQYNYLQINEESYFDDIENKTVNLRLIEEVQGQDRKLIITVSEQKLKFTL